jgi:hypothetical protein
LNRNPFRSFSVAEFIQDTPISEVEKRRLRYYLEYCYGKGRVFGEYYAYLTADYLNLPISGECWDLQRLSTYLRAFAITDDDLRDIPQRKSDCAVRQLRDFFLERAYREVQLFWPVCISAMDIFESELAAYRYTADLYDRRRSEMNVFNINKSYTTDYANGVALARVPLRIFGARPGSENLVESGCWGISAVLRALQILDDLVDWKEDIAEGRVTYPIICYLATLPKAKAESIAQRILDERYRDVRILIRALRKGLPFQPNVREQIEFTYDILCEAETHLAKGLGVSLLERVADIRKRVAGAISPQIPTDATRDANLNLIKRLKQSGAAPKRSGRERGEDVRSRC